MQVGESHAFPAARMSSCARERPGEVRKLALRRVPVVGKERGYERGLNARRYRSSENHPATSRKSLGWSRCQLVDETELRSQLLQASMSVGKGAPTSKSALQLDTSQLPPPVTNCFGALSNRAGAFRQRLVVDRAVEHA